MVEGGVDMRNAEQRKVTEVSGATKRDRTSRYKLTVDGGSGRR